MRASSRWAGDDRPAARHNVVFQMVRKWSQCVKLTHQAVLANSATAEVPSGTQDFHAFMGRFFPSAFFLFPFSALAPFGSS
jgi:hypothetical protein